MYEGSDKKPGRYITKDLCKEWSDGYNIQTEYGYRYLHSGNIILFKVYNIENDIYSTLIIHFKLLYLLYFINHKNNSII